MSTNKNSIIHSTLSGEKWQLGSGLYYIQSPLAWTCVHGLLHLSFFTGIKMQYKRENNNG